MSTGEYSLQALADILQLELQGDGDITINGLATLSAAQADELAFLANPRYAKQLEFTEAAAVIVTAESAELFSGAKLISKNPYLSYAKASQLFKKIFSLTRGVHPSAVVSETASVATSASIGPHCVIGDNVFIGENVRLLAGVYIGDDSCIGDNSLLYANSSVYHHVSIGRDVIIHSGAVIGADGFGFAPKTDGWEKIEQLGGVVIGNRVEIGANTTIDRGALDDTNIGDDVIIDNLVQIAHNVIIGEGTAIAANTAIAGSAKIGRRCTIAGSCGIVGHIELCDGVHITAATVVTKSIKHSGSYSSGTPMQETSQWRKSAVRIAQLNDLNKKVKQLEQQLSATNKP